MKRKATDSLPGKAQISPLPEVRNQGGLAASSAFATGGLMEMAQAAILAGAEHTVTDNGDGTYCHMFKAPEDEGR